jgi:methionyl-tRNA formyltransferase
MGAELLVNTLRQIEAGTILEVSQDHIEESTIKHAPKLFKENTKIDWKLTAQEIHQLICGLSPYPAAWSVWENNKGEHKTVKFFKSSVLKETADNDLLSLWNDKQTIYIQCEAGVLCIHEFQLEGKKRLQAKD